MREKGREGREKERGGWGGGNGMVQFERVTAYFMSERNFWMQAYLVYLFLVLFYLFLSVSLLSNLLLFYFRSYASDVQVMIYIPVFFHMFWGYLSTISCNETYTISVNKISLIFILFIIFIFPEFQFIPKMKCCIKYVSDKLQKKKKKYMLLEIS